MRPVFAIALKDLRQRIRDRSAIVIGLVAPVVIAALMSLAFRGVDTLHFTLGVVNLDHGPVASALTKVLGEGQLRQIATVTELNSAATARSNIRAGHLGAAIVIPPGFSASVTGTRSVTLTTLGTANNAIAQDITNAVASSFSAQVNADRLSVATAHAAGATVTTTELGRLVAGLHIPVQAVSRAVGARQLKVISYYAPAMAIFFLLFTISFTARTFFVDRSQGMVERMRAAPVRPGAILVGKSLSVLVFGAVSLAAIGIITSLAFGADWGQPLAAVLLGLTLVVSVVCLTTLVIGLCRTQRQAEGVSSFVVFGLALLGGNFFFISSAPPLMRRLALFTPNGWALRGFTDLATLGGGLGTVVEPIVAIGIFSVIVGTIAMTVGRRAVVA